MNIKAMRGLTHPMLLCAMLFELSVGCGDVRDSQPPGGPTAALDSGGAPQPTTGAGRLRVTPNAIHLSADNFDAPMADTVLQLCNIGSEQLHIHHIESRCGCMVPMDRNYNELAPGECQRLTVSVSFPPRGRRSTSLVIHTDSRNTPELQVPVFLEGRPLNPPWVLDAPDSVRLTAELAGSLASEDVFLTTVERPGPPWITKLIPGNSRLQVGDIEVVKETPLDDEPIQRIYRCRIEAAVPETAVARNVDVLQIATSGEESTFPLPKIFVFAEFTPAVRAVPEHVIFRISETTSFPTEMTLLLIPRSDTPWAITCSDIPDWLSISGDVSATKASGPKRLTFSADQSLCHEIQDTSGIDTEVKITTTFPSLESLAVKLSVIRPIASTHIAPPK